MATRIAWTDETWNCVYGCSEVTRECALCYAKNLTHRFAKRLAKMARDHGIEPVQLTRLTAHGVKWTGRLMPAPWRLDIPLQRKKPSLYFVNSMSDLFHKDVSEDFIQQVFDVMRRAHWHEFQVLTKRPERVLDMDSRIDWPENVWMGTSVGVRDSMSRIDLLRQTGAALKFISAEPLLESLAGIDLTGIDWVIAGGESQAGCRHMELRWARELRDACLEANIPYFLKQLGGWPDKRADEKAVLDGKTWTEYPRLPAHQAPAMKPIFTKPKAKNGKAKDPKMVAAGHKAWETRRQNAALRAAGEVS